MKIKILGTGKKLHPSCKITKGNQSILIDVGPDIQSKLSNKEICDLSAILITHGHRASIDGLPILSQILKENICVYASIEVIKQIKLRWSSQELDGIDFVSILPSEVLNICNFKIKPVLVEHAKNYATFGFSIDNDLFYASDMTPNFKSKYMKNNYLAILDGSKCNQTNKVCTHIDLAKDLNKVLQLNNQVTLFLSPDNTLESDVCINKFLKERSEGVRLAQEGEVLYVNSKELGTEEYTSISYVPKMIDSSRMRPIQKGVNYNREYVLSKKALKLSLKGALYVLEPVIKGKVSIVVDKKRKIVYERVITSEGKEIMTDLLAHKDHNLAESSLLARLVYTYKNWNSLLVPKYLPRRRVATKSNLTKVLKYYRRFEQVLIRPLSSKYADGKFMIKFNTTSNKADNLGQLETPGGDPMPRPISGLKTYRCTKCAFEFQSIKKESKCPLCGGKVTEVKNKEKDMKKDISLPADQSRPTLLDKILLRVLGTDVLKQTSMELPVPFYKVAIYSQAINQALLGKETKVIDLKWGEIYIPATYENLEVKRDTKERLLVSGYVCVKDDTPLVLHFRPGWGCQFLTIYSRESQVEKASELLKNIQSFVKQNNPWKNEKVTPFGRFLPPSSLDISKVILAPDIKERLDKIVLRFFSSKSKFTAANIPFKRGVIFSGVPGTGKTLSGKVIMNSVKDVTFIWVTARDFISLSTSYLFDMARELQPVVLFIEDVDRCLTGSTLDAIKTQMDGLESNEGILTILSTNFPEQLPKTLIDRPGRFDDVIEFTLPNAALRFKVLWLYSQKINIKDKKHTLAAIAKVSEGLTPAHLKEVIVSAYVANDTSELTLEDLRKSLGHLKELHNRFNFSKSEINVNGYKSIVQKIKECTIREKKRKSDIKSE